MTARRNALGIGTIIEGRYKLLALLGSGAFGMVYKAVQLTTEQLVAIKVLHIDVDVADRAETEIARFQREMKLLGRITHPNIVRLIDSGRLSDGSVFIAMEYVRGESLADLVERRGPIPIRQVCRLMTQVLEALGRAHRDGVVHRDLKPHNIMVSDPGPRCNAMVLDFGISFIVEEARDEDYRTLTARNQVAGTPAYMAPEQLVQGLVTPAADLYGWGLVFMEALTARPAVSANSLVKLIMRHTLGEPIELPEVLAKSPLGGVFSKATATDLADRYASVDEALQDLEAVDMRGAWVDSLEAELLALAPPRQEDSEGESVSAYVPTTVKTPRSVSAVEAESEDFGSVVSSLAPVTSKSSESLDETLPWVAPPDMTPAEGQRAVETAESSGEPDEVDRPSSTPPPSSAGHSARHRPFLLTAVIVSAVSLLGILFALARPGRMNPIVYPTPSAELPIVDEPVVNTNAFLSAALSQVPAEVDAMVTVPAGSFIMGCLSPGDPLCDGDERPSHQVDIDAFEIDLTEVSVAAYARCVEAGVCEEPMSHEPRRRRGCNWGHADRFDHPVNCVPWYQAQIYCEWLGRRLPTEAEWERAARGSGSRMYPWGDSPPTCDLVAMSSDTQDCVLQSTRPVGSFPENASPFGVLDMAGNLWEWTSDWYGRDYYRHSPARNPTGPPQGDERVVRGGGFDDDERDMRVSERNDDTPWETDEDTGFRCARTLNIE
jgi:formylglycine-generating enzyme required for sulfatase activity